MRMDIASEHLAEHHPHLGPHPLGQECAEPVCPQHFTLFVAGELQYVGIHVGHTAILIESNG